MGKKLKSLLVTCLTLALVMPSMAAAEKEKVTYNDINQMLTESALEHNIPPEIAKAVALKESAWRQWADDAQTEPYVNSKDGGIGLMQVTSHVCEGDETKNCYDPERLGSDVRYNIDAGLDILNEKWSYGVDGIIPTINTNDRDILEHWYFAIMAYNGTVPVNSPYFRDSNDGTRNVDTYQDKVLALVEKHNYLDLNTEALVFQRDDFTYDSEKDASIVFNKMHYTVDEELTRSRTLLKEGDKVSTVEGKVMKDSPSSTKEIKINKSETATVLDSQFYIDETKNSLNPTEHWVRYHVKLVDGRTGYMASSSLIPLTERLSGSNRYNTSIEISKDGWQDGAETVVISRGGNFPDALAGAPLAYQEDAPILLTPDNELTDELRNEIKRLNPKTAVILGSENAVSQAIENELSNMGMKINRIGGDDRFETAELIAAELHSTNNKAVLALGMDFPDALAVAPYAAKEGMPILLTKKDSLPDSTKDALSGVKRTIVLGGSAVVNDRVYQQLSDDRVRLAGNDRFGTAKEIMDYFGNGSNTGYVANGMGFADALTGAVLAAKNDAPLILSKKTDLSTAMEKTIVDQQLSLFVLIGGPAAINVDSELAGLAVK
ncbi:cell wall-binding repeat-containing protein [Bacillus sp. N1-1]|uniref:cell wall-binding repeat-containing protein n=1 Tax=Bacillus sp. N1-1 TaxID=2682541 RepID=UPI00135727A4|nr:cell wall-binding repeat-containing protein [Bacillus sp. N1-1]